MSGLKIGKYYGEDTSKKTYLISEILENGYTDITSIEMIVKASDFANKDFLFTKDFLTSYVSTIDINSISNKEKHYCVNILFYLMMILLVFMMQVKHLFW